VRSPRELRDHSGSDAAGRDREGDRALPEGHRDRPEIRRGPHAGSPTSPMGSLWRPPGRPGRPCAETKAEAEKALELDPQQGDAFAGPRRPPQSCDFDWTGAERDYRRAWSSPQARRSPIHLRELPRAAVGTSRPRRSSRSGSAEQLDPLSNRSVSIAASDTGVPGVTTKPSSSSGRCSRLPRFGLRRSGRSPTR